MIVNNNYFISSLQGNESSKAKGGHSASSIDIQKMKSIKSDVPGNSKCVDCDAPSKFIWQDFTLGGGTFFNITIFSILMIIINNHF